MPTPAGPDTNQFRCESCGRYFNTADELAAHQAQCLGAREEGSGSQQTFPERSREEDREWRSTP